MNFGISGEKQHLILVILPQVPYNQYNYKSAAPKSIEIGSKTCSEFKIKETPISPAENSLSAHSSIDSREYRYIENGFESSLRGDSIRSQSSKAAFNTLKPLSTSTDQTILEKKNLSIDWHCFSAPKIQLLIIQLPNKLFVLKFFSYTILL